MPTPVVWLAEQYDRHGQQVYSLALHILKDRAEAEKVVVESFLVLYRARVSGAAGIEGDLLHRTQDIAVQRLGQRSSRPLSVERTS